VRVFGKAAEPPATPPTQGALAPIIAPALPASTLPTHPLSATPLALTRLKPPKKKRKRPRPVARDQDPLPGLDQFATDDLDVAEEIAGPSNPDVAKVEDGEDVAQVAEGAQVADVAGVGDLHDAADLQDVAGLHDVVDVEVVQFVPADVAAGEPAPVVAGGEK
jgi:hypothetical protein